MSFVFYDVETTGLRKPFDQILQFAAIRTDADLDELDAFETSSRLLPYIIPAPEALHTNGIAISDITSAAQKSHYAMMLEIRACLDRWSPCTFLGFNSINFDEEFLRHGFYRCLLPPYPTNTPPNTRGDILHLARAFASFHPDEIVVPTAASGRPTFALRPLVIANGFPDFNAHQAMADVRALLYLARRIAERAPELWSRYQHHSQKRAASEFIQEQEAFLYFDASWEPAGHCVTWVSANPAQANIQYCLSLMDNLEPLFAADDEGLRSIVANNRAIVLRLKTNSAPLLCELADAPSHFLTGRSEREYRDLARRVRADRSFLERLTQACVATERTFAPAAHVEQQLYDQPFWPPREENALLVQFHSSAWENRPAIATHFADKRTYQLARRLTFTERPDVLPALERAKLAEGLRRRITESTADVPWLTVSAALDVLDTFVQGISVAERAPLLTYRQYLVDLHSS